MPELEQFIILDDAGMYVLLAILVIVVAFGIFNTILMSVLERKREFGVMLALGMRPRSLFRLVYLESLILAFVGLVIGLGIGILLVLYFQANPIELSGRELVQAMEMIGAEPILTWKLKIMNPIGSVLTVLCVAVLAALYPAIVASKGRPVDVLRSL
jgi:ABC-type antimicrobial peptide transport system permease subunit